MKRGAKNQRRMLLCVCANGDHQDGYKDRSASNAILGGSVAELRHCKHDLGGVLVFVADYRRFHAFVIVRRHNQRFEMQLGEFDKTHAFSAIQSKSRT